MRLLLSLLLLTAFILPRLAHAGTDPAILHATAAVQAEIPRAESDPAHPIFHITGPAQWINDPNGPIFYKGYYHLFYQLYPFSDQDGPKYWGHVRSRDLVKWETLPVALAPSSELGEEAIWSGCCTINGLGQPMIFYTSIAGGKSPGDHAEQWAATSDDNLITWQKSPANPVLSEDLNGGRKINDWRDPFVFHDGKKTFLVTGGHIGAQATVNIYEATNPQLTNWRYRGVLFNVPDAPTAECPNFFKLGNQWVLFVSPYGKVKYFTGDFDADSCRFTPHAQGLLDYGPNFYAPNTMLVPDGRRITWGWVTGFISGHGWNGCLSVPRLLSLSADGQLHQRPAPQLEKLRGKPVAWHNVDLTNGGVWQLPPTNTLEIRLNLDLQTATGIELKIQPASTTQPAVVVNFSGSELKLMESGAPLTLAKNQNLNLRIFLDRSVVEVFANDTVCLTKTIPALASGATLAIRTEGGPAKAKLIEAWPLKSIW